MIVLDTHIWVSSSGSNYSSTCNLRKLVILFKQANQDLTELPAEWSCNF